jgi:two-component system KDP operon response regulator KdpE
MNTGQTLPFSGPPRVLVLVAESVLASLINLTLTHGTHLVRRAATFEEAVAMLDVWHPHLAIIEMDVAGGQLLGSIGRFRPSGATRLPVLALTRRGDLKTKLAAFDQGVDDIMTVPFPPEELLARVLAIIRRSYGEAISFHPVLKLGEIEIDILNRQVRAGTAEVQLTGLEQSLLYLLASNAGKIVTREQITEAIWGPDYIAESNIVDRHVRNLRAKLNDDWRQPRFIATEPGKGYRFLPVLSDRD